jgi:hypothetical protein
MTTFYTARQIALALGRTTRGVRKALEGNESRGTVVIQGKAVAGWELEQLPERMIEQLAQMVQRRSCANVEQLLANPPEVWKPKIQGKTVTLADLAVHCIEDARQLQRALSGSLDSIHELKITRPEIEQAGLREYHQIMGHPISVAHWWRLVNRTLARDGGVRTFHRLELFLADKLAFKEPRPVSYSAAAAELIQLQRWLLEVKDLNHPTFKEAKMIWDAAFGEIEAMVEAGRAERIACRVVIKALVTSGVTLAKNKAALMRNFNRKFGRWVEGGKKPSALEDKRSKSSGNFCALQLPESDRLTLIARSVECGGRIAQGWRKARQRGELSFETTQRFIENPHNKSYVPQEIREAVTNDVRLLSNLHHGPRLHRLKGAYITRDYDDCAAGDWFQGDDVTLNHYYWEETPAGIVAMRGQWLLFVDVRTNYILGFALHSERHYNARIIRECITRIHDQYGLPRQGFYFEKGIWKNARILTGAQRGDELPFTVTEEGLREFVRFKHARTPRAKVIERIIGILQNETEELPGYVGRNEITDHYERIQQKLAQARLGKIPYASFLFSKEQWIRQLEQVCERYNEEEQGVKLGGLSPREAWEWHFTTPLMRLPAPLRFLLANHRKPLRVTRNGIRLICKGQSHFYRNAVTSRLINQEVLVWYQTDEEVPASITITDLERANPVEVPVEIKPASMTADFDEFEAAQAQVKAHNAYAKTLYRVIQPRFTKHKVFREVLADEESIELGQKMAHERKNISAERQRVEVFKRKIRKHERARGLAPARQVRDPEGRLRGFEQLQRADELEKESGG